MEHKVVLLMQLAEMVVLVEVEQELVNHLAQQEPVELVTLQGKARRQVLPKAAMEDTLLVVVEVEQEIQLAGVVDLVVPES